MPGSAGHFSTRYSTFWTLEGVPLPRELNPRRPVASAERCQRTREAMRLLHEAAQSNHERRLWLTIALAPVPPMITGRRLGSIRKSRRDDLDFESETLY